MKKILTPDDDGAMTPEEPQWTHCVVDTYHNEVRCYCTSREECIEAINEQIRVDSEIGAPGMYEVVEL